MNDPALPWVESARRSLEAAEVLHTAQLWPQTCFNAQQCAELIMKAAIVRAGVAPPRVHGIIELVTHLDPALQSSLQHLTNGLQDLDRYYAPTRYPDAQPGALAGGLPGQQDATEALAVATEVMTIIEAYLSGP
jgi:HEPN domain-containing protein